MGELSQLQEGSMGRPVPQESPYKYTVRCFHTHESLGPCSYELAKEYESALKRGESYITINSHAVPRKVYVEHKIPREWP